MDDDARLEAFFADLAARTGTAPVTAEEAAELLDLARVVAHTVERKYAPLATYAAGLALDPDLPPDERTARIRAVKDAVADLTR
jgi:hypothetical protein